MTSIEHNGTAYEVDEDGFLLNGSEEWDTNWVDYVKSVESIGDLTNEHRKIMNALREYYEKNGIAPMVRILSKTTRFSEKKIRQLFPGQTGRIICMISGLPVRKSSHLIR